MLSASALAVARPRRLSRPPIAQEMTSVDPIRCWWQTSTGAVAIGEAFDVTPDVRRARHRSRAGRAGRIAAGRGVDPAGAIRDPRRLASAGLRTAGRAGSSNTDYSLRIIDATSIGRDVNVPVLPIQYRVHSRVGANASLEGRDLTYLLPAQPIKVLSLVPGRRGRHSRRRGRASARVEALRFRASLFQIVALALGAVAAVMALLALAAADARRAGTRRQADDGRLPDRIVLHHVAAELEGVKRAAAVEGWTDGPRGPGARRAPNRCGVRARPRASARNRWRNGCAARLRAGSRPRTAGRDRCACRSRAR